MNWRDRFVSTFLAGLLVACSGSLCLALDYPIVDTGQQRCYDNWREIQYPKPGEPFFGQDAQYQGNQPAYRDNGDGTVTDLVTGLMWQKEPGPKKTFADAVAGASACRTGRYDDWRLPSIKSLYSLILFSGEDPDPQSRNSSQLRPFIDISHFGFRYGDPAKGERVIDSQFATSTRYVSTTMHGNATMFGVNFADGRIKGYPISHSGRPGRQTKTYSVLYVRGNPAYGQNQFHDNGDGTITDHATGLTWTRFDSGYFKVGKNKDGRLNWEQALLWAEELEYAGRSDWRLPNIKELQSIVDYTRSPDTTQSAAIDPVFSVTPIRDALGTVNYPFYWSSTTHKRMGGGEAAAYVAFGRSQGWMPGFRRQYDLLDVHGAGSQRSDPKSGDPSKFPHGRGPQGDVIAIDNMVRPVRGGQADVRESGPEPEPQPAARRGRGPRATGPMGAEGQGFRGNGSGAPIGSNRPGFVHRLDRNSDGKVSRQEFDGPADAFDRLDVNQDGFLEESESPARRNVKPRQGQRPNMRSRTQPGRRPGQRPEANHAPLPQRFDRNEDGKFARQKFDGLPSFVFILADDIGWTGLSCPMDDRVADSRSDFYQTPQIAELTRQGMRFSNAYSPSSMCTPSRASLLTGKSPALLRITTPGPAKGQPQDRKLIRFYESNETRLFDLDRDLGERNDLTAQMPDKAATLAKRLDTYLAEIGAQLPSPNPDYKPAIRPGRLSRQRGRNSRRTRPALRRTP